MAGLQQYGSQWQRRARIPLRHARHGMLEQDRNFFFAVAERRKGQGESVQPIVKIFAQALGGERFRNIDVGRGQNAHVNFNDRAAAQPGKLLVLQNVQQLGLQKRRHFPDFIQQDRALVAELEFAGLGVDRAGKCARFVSEEFAFQQVVRERPRN